MIMQSTFCGHVYQHCQNSGRSLHVINLDPAADVFTYPVSADIRELISVSEVMEQFDLGPNGALLYCMEYLEENLGDWLFAALEGYDDEDCVVFDCPGQIELYSHHSVFRTLVNQMHDWSWRLVAVYMLDSQFITDASKFIAGCLQCQAAMMNFQLPHINVLTKIDLLPDKALIEPYLTPDGGALVSGLQADVRPALRRLDDSVAQLLDDYSMVSFRPLDLSDFDSVSQMLYTIDCAVQFGEDSDVRTSRYEDMHEGIL